MIDDASSAEEPPRRGRGRPRDPAVDGRITAAAADLMLRRGFDNTTVDDVASLAGVGKATVYRRWPSKEDLALTAMTELFENEFPAPDTGSIRGDIEASVRQLVHFVNTEQGAAFVRMSIAESIRDPRIAGLYRESIERTEQSGHRMLARAIARGEVRPDVNVDLALQWLLGYVTSRAVSGRSMPTVEDIPSMVDWALYGLTLR